MKKITIFLTAVLFMFLISTAQAAPGQEVTYELLDYFESLTAPLPPQSEDNLWTFWSDNSYLLPPSPSIVQYYDYDVSLSILGSIIQAGDTEIGTGDATPTFNGVFVSMRAQHILQVLYSVRHRILEYRKSNYLVR